MNPSQKLVVLVLFFAFCTYSISAQRKDTGPKPKNIHGVVQDLRGTALADARVYVRDKKTNVVRTLTTDQDGLYKIFGLPPTVDYEIYAEFKGKASERKTVSSFLNREDNVLNFQLDLAIIEAGGIQPVDDEPAFTTFDLVDLHGSFDMPTGVPAPIPAVLLLHGYGEDRSVWRDFARQLVSRGWAVMTLDLRGHGESKTKNRRPIQPSQEWRTSPHEFPSDVDPALDWLKARPRINTQKIVIVGTDIGADLALIASGKFPEVRTVVAIKPNLMESLAMAGSAQDFQPRSALIIHPDDAEGNRIKALVRAPSRVLVASVAGGTGSWVADRQVSNAVFQWLKETF